MGFRLVMIENDAEISLKLDNIIIRQEGKEVWIPMDDISMLVIDNRKIT